MLLGRNTCDVVVYYRLIEVAGCVERAIGLL